MFQSIVYVFIFISGSLSYDQNDYIIDYERLEVFDNHSQYAHHIKVVNFKYNRTSFASNYSANFAVDFEDKLMVHVQGYRWASNEYRLFPITFTFNFCSAIRKNDFGLRNLYKCGNFPKCPMRQRGPVLFCNYQPDQSKFPPYIPEGRYRTDLQFVYLSTEIQLLQIFGTIKRPIPYPKK